MTDDQGHAGADEPTGGDELAGAEAEAAREAAALAGEPDPGLNASDTAAPEAAPAGAADPESSPADAGDDSPRVIRPRARTAGAPSRRNRGTEPVAGTDVTSAGQEALELENADEPTVHADRVSVNRGGIGEVTARAVELRMGGIGRANADDVSVTLGGIGVARGRITVEMGGIGAAFGDSVSVTQGYIGPTLAREVRLEQGFIRQVIAGRVTFGERSGAGLVIAGRTDGPVRTLLDWRGALAFGAAFGLVVALVRRRR